MLQELIANTITLNLAETRGVLGNILFCGTEVIRGKSDPSHVLHRFMTVLPHARSVSKATLDSDAAAMMAIFKASGEGKAVAGGGFG